MKRSPLKRKTPLKRGNGHKLKKSKLRNVSTEKKKWNALYALSKLQNPAPSELSEAHHPLGRVGDRILCWIWVERGLHEWIHEKSKEARSMNWLLPEYDGRISTGFEKRPWKSGQESHWPDKYKREQIGKIKQGLEIKL